MKKIALFLLVLGLTGCGPPVKPFDIGGSKADGTVVMGATIDLFSGPVSWESAHGDALRRCQAWGYSRVEPFSGVRTRCIQHGMYGCDREEITRTYQCID